MTFNLLTRIALAICFAVMVATGEAAAQQTTQAETKDRIRIVWRSDHDNSKELARAIEQLYLALYNTGNLPIRIIEDPVQTKRTLAEILADQEQYFGNAFPLGLDSVLCDLNPNTCSRERKSVTRSKRSSITKHVGGTKISRGRWRNSANTAVIIPDLQFRTYFRIGEVLFNNGEDVVDFLRSQNADCSQWKLPCLALVERLNRAFFDRKRDPKLRPNTLKIPMLGYETVVYITSAETGKTKTVIDELNISQFQTSNQRYNKPNGFSRKWRTYLEKKAVAADLFIDALKDHIPSFGKAGSQGHGGDTHVELQKDLLSLINHPFSSSGAIDDYLKFAVPIAVIDFTIDHEHCELSGAVKIDSELRPNEPTPPDRSQASECGTMMADKPNRAHDHGTHVTGLIAAATNDRGVVGLNPFAKVKYVELDAAQLGQAEYRKKVGDKILLLGQSAGEELRVANVSWRYENFTNLDPIRHGIDNLKGNTLFVVAAGNKNLKDMATAAACNVFPACYHDKDNVITVVGLNRNKLTPELWYEDVDNGSNSSPKFGIGAIAVGVLSTTYGNHIGTMSGTSQAAPQVAAAASLIHSRFEKQFAVEQPLLLPIRVKNRIIYTSDLFNSLFTKVKGGRLNVSKALDMAREYVEIKVDSNTQVHRGVITKFGKFERGQDEYIECQLGNRSLRQVKYKAIRRMFYDEPRRKYVIYYNRNEDNRDSVLERITDCRLKTRTHSAIMESDDTGGEVTFQFRDIRDYVSGMF